MIVYDFVRPSGLDHVSQLLASNPGRSKLIAGGTDLLVQLREESEALKSVELVIDLSALATELATVKEEDDALVIGALVTHDMGERHPLIRREFPHLSAACASVGSPQIRHLGTLGGGVCNGSPAADPVPALISCDTDVLIHGTKETRSQPLPEFCARIGKDALADDEFVTGFRVKKLPPSARTAFVKLGRRKALAVSRLNVAVVVISDGSDRIESVRLAPGCIFRVPGRVTAAERYLTGKAVSKEAFAEAGEIVAREMIERTGYRWSTPYKEIAVKAIVADALCHATGLEVF
ncbi:MAG: xanthine dehydrogenase family protein subunit M [Fastidiosipila sp.]|jgi:CO/xanthine dehydrogenase FAD-binding subunit|nr:xanthine dehydrogenase family protein subunit M [Fastidiosipila sp.]